MVRLIYFYLEQVNLFVLVGSLAFGFILNVSFKLKNLQTLLIKNFVLFFFSLSFSLFMVQLAAYFQLLGKPYSIYNVDFCSNLLIFLVYIVGLVSLLTLGDRF